ncbi:MAG: YitT family protein [Clostridia bacterium]|nr:YitT family protein [Clostridia bacterium]MBO5298954.1 YitT family protein [Clostridia bacterium]
MSTKTKEFLKDIASFIIGSFIYSIAVNTFTLPNRIAPGGMVGISTIINYFTHLPVGTMSLVLNIPLFLLSFKMVGKKTTLRILLSSFIFYIMTDVTSVFLPQYTENILVAAIFGGVLAGAGVGVINMRGVSTGGTDLMCQLVTSRFHGASYGTMLTIIDAIVVIIAAIAFKDLNAMLYAAVTIYITGIVLDKVSNGLDKAKLVQVFTEDPTFLSSQIMEKMDRGVTLVKAKGAYTGMDKEMVMIVVKRFEMQKLKTLIKSTDPKAFIIIGDVAEVLGEGFKDDKKNA